MQVLEVPVLLRVVSYSTFYFYLSDIIMSVTLLSQKEVSEPLVNLQLTFSFRFVFIFFDIFFGIFRISTFHHFVSHNFYHCTAKSHIQAKNDRAGVFLGGLDCWPCNPTTDKQKI